jgi:hypothetical protein
MVTRLAETQQFGEAADRAMSSTFAKGHLINLLFQWNRNAPDEASQWLKTADLPPEERYRLNQRASVMP